MPETAHSTDAYPHIGILGAGAWGVALAHVAIRAGRATTLWSRNPLAHGQCLAAPVGAVTTSDLERVSRTDAVLVVVPAQRMREVLADFRPPPGTPIVICAKGVEHATGMLMTEVLAEAVPGAEPGILSGPSFARDVIAGMPTAVTVAARASVALRLQASLGHAAFRP
jgi:glycerol-3-phosphate dehydrogenase (NAD(P)+)